MRLDLCVDRHQPVKKEAGSHSLQINPGHLLAHSKTSLLPRASEGAHRNNNKSCHTKGCGEKGTLLHCWWECKLVQPLWRTVWRFLKKLKIELPYDPAIPLLGIYLEKTKTLIQKDTCTLMFTAALFTIAKTWKQPKCSPTEEWIKKMWYIYIYSGILLSHRKE